MENEPSWMNKSTVKKKSQKKERLRAKELGGKVQPGSGNQFFAKADIKLDNFLIEHKYTDGKGYSLTLETLKLIERQARSVAKLPAMIIEIQEQKYVVLRYEDCQ